MTESHDSTTPLACGRVLSLALTKMTHLHTCGAPLSSHAGQDCFGTIYSPKEA